MSDYLHKPCREIEAKLEGQIEELREGLWSAVEYLRPRVTGGKVGVKLLVELEALLNPSSADAIMLKRLRQSE